MTLPAYLSGYVNREEPPPYETTPEKLSDFWYFQKINHRNHNFQKYIFGFCDDENGSCIYKSSEGHHSVEKADYHHAYEMQQFGHLEDLKYFQKQLDYAHN